ncbi:hypothetical protein IAT38_001667 [Cryptococcus sp. DSM 104549]
MFRWHDCLEGHILLGLVLTMISFICLILTTFSSPFIKPIYFLEAPSDDNASTPDTRFGTFGYCSDPGGCTGTSVGYEWEGGEIVEWMTKTGILFGFAALFVLLAFMTLILSLLRVGKFMWNPVYFRTTALLGTLFALLAEAFALVLWVKARHAYDDEGTRATYGASLWLGLVGTLAAFFAAGIGGPAYQGQFMYRADRQQAYNV